MARRLAGFLVIAVLLGLAAGPVAAAADHEARLREFVRDRLTEAVLMFDRHFRVPETGQYRDYVAIGEADQSRSPSSTAATGIGLIALAIGDALGVVEDAEAKASRTLAHLLGEPDEGGFKVARSANGWFPHFVDALTGRASPDVENKFSTIDTTLLAAGAAIAGRYFDGKSSDEGRGRSDVFRLAERLIDGVDWDRAIHDVDAGELFFAFTGPDEAPETRLFARPFDEYAALACIAMRAEERAGVDGPAHDLFAKHYADAATLPMSDYHGVKVIGRPEGAFVSHFAHQFVWFYCDALNRQPAFARALRRSVEADRLHFAIKRAEGRGVFPPALWGLGAGAEIKFDEAGAFKAAGYGVSALEKNKRDTASPAIMAGFAALYHDGEAGDPLEDLYTLWADGTCRYEHEGLRFLWRCSARDPSLKVWLVEAVDFSTYLLGLAARDEKIGLSFFRDFNL